VKLLCLIITIYVTVLSIKPCCADNDCRDKKELAGKSPVKEKECLGCSSFFTCGTCTGFIVTKSFTPELNPFARSSNYTYADYPEPGLQQISLTIWQPPQLG